jgi:hypothetical protein
LTFWSGGGFKARELAADKAGQRSTAASRRGGAATWRYTPLATLAALATLAIFAKKPAGSPSFSGVLYLLPILLL